MAHVWIIAAAVIALILLRPKGWPEAIWACAGAALFLLMRSVSVAQAGNAIARGTDVYLFLAGMMLLAELARFEGVFEWLAGEAVDAARGSSVQLLLLVYGAGVLVTVFLSNDATAVVLTPAVYAAVRRARAAPMPHLLACAFIANAASFVLPISNPANLVVFGTRLPPLIPWLKTFGIPSLAAIAITYAVLHFISRSDLRQSIEAIGPAPALSPSGRKAAFAIASACAVLVASSALGRDPGLPVFAAGLAAVLISNHRVRVARGISWSVLPLVAGLFVMVEALDRAGASQLAAQALHLLSAMPRAAGVLSASFGIGFLCNAMNNLPAGLLTGTALRETAHPQHILNALLIGIDLGPNLSVTGSLATILWLVALRREGMNVTAWQFLKAGAMVTPLALSAAVLLLRLS